MATIKCPLDKRGSPSHEWHDGEKSRIYCQGWEDKRTDEPLEVCLNCPDHVSKAQDDLEKWQAEHGNNLQIAAQKRLIYAEDLFEPVDCSVLMVHKGGQQSGKTMAMYEEIFRKRVEMAPTVDAVPVVRCHECQQSYESPSSSTGYRCKAWGVYDQDCDCDPNGFCHKAERRE